LEQLLSEPTADVVQLMRETPGDFIFLGVAGKMGPTMARMAKRASDLAGTERRIIGVSRFSNHDQIDSLEEHGIEAIRCDLMNEAAVQQLPDAPNVIYLAGMKFGATGNEATTWAMNTLLPAAVCRRYRRSRIVAFSTGNVYGLTPVGHGGSVETDTPNPVGEYAMSCLGRERTFEYFSRTLKIPVALIRLNYACELRYGVLVDIAQQIRAGRTIDVSMGHLNTIWQADANAMALLSLAHAASPPFVINQTGPELVNIRAVAHEFGKRMGKPVASAGHEAPTALLSNAKRAFDLFGKPRVNVNQMMEWIADWVARGGASLGKPTHFESRDGKF
jgi:nucleoside-diphosphate-sugar epimerase